MRLRKPLQKHKSSTKGNDMNGKTRTVALAMTGLVALGGAVACGSSSSGGSSSTATAPTSGSSSSPAQPVAQLNNLTGDHTQVILDAGFLKALTSLKVTPGVISPATLNAKTGTLTFPITGGSATYYTPGTRTPYVESHIVHQGSGLTLTAGGKKVGLENFVVDAGKSVLTGDVTLNGKSVGKNLDLFFLDGSSLQPLSKNAAGTKAILYGTKVYLTQDAADLLTKTYGLKAGTLTTSTLIGVAKITLNLS
jgi:hypothetical protein